MGIERFQGTRNAGHFVEREFHILFRIPYLLFNPMPVSLDYVLGF